MSGYQFGIEEEYFISDLRSKTVRSRMSKRFFRACKKALGDRVMNEMLQSQIEVATAPCQTMEEARNQLRRFRETLANRAVGPRAWNCRCGNPPSRPMARARANRQGPLWSNRGGPATRWAPRHAVRDACSCRGFRSRQARGDHVPSASFPADFSCAQHLVAILASASNRLARLPPGCI
jgi:Glutamate-cysteine ligase family 2(GCS2)